MKEGKKIVKVSDEWKYMGNKNEMKKEIRVREKIMLWKKLKGGEEIDIGEEMEEVDLEGVEKMNLGYI